MPVFNVANMRARLDELNTQRESILAASTPLRAARDAFLAEKAAQEEVMNAEIRGVEEGLYDIDMERGLLAKALGGRSIHDGDQVNADG
jgi:hypothetical protein